MAGRIRSFHPLPRFIVILFIGFVLLAFANSGIVLYPFALLIHNGKAGYSVTAQQLFINIILILSSIWVARLGWREIGFRQVGVRVFIHWMLIGLLPIICYIVLALLVHEPIFAPPKELLLKAVTDVVPFALFEEIYFRGILLTYLLKYLTRWQAILIESLCFGLWHFQVYPHQPLAWLLLAGLGVLLSLSRVNSNSLYPAVVAHVVHNLALHTWN